MEPTQLNTMAYYKARMDELEYENKKLALLIQQLIFKMEQELSNLKETPALEAICKNR